MAIITPEKLLEFWFSDEIFPKIFTEDPWLDEKLREEYYSTWAQATQGLLVDWRKTIRGRVAEIIVLDQFSRNIARGDRRSFAQDGMAVVLAQEVVLHPEYDTLDDNEKKFVLLPFMHSESLAIHEWAEPYFAALNDPKTQDFEDQHVAVLEEFGRYPYQNKELGRKNTQEEEAFLERTQGKTYGDGKEEQQSE